MKRMKRRGAFSSGKGFSHCFVLLVISCCGAIAVSVFLIGDLQSGIAGRHVDVNKIMAPAEEVYSLRQHASSGRRETETVKEPVQIVDTRVGTTMHQSQQESPASTALVPLGRPAISPTIKRQAAVQHKNLSAGGGAFVHIGKTGGSTLSILLRDGCHSFMVHPCRNIKHESIASRRISSYYHVPDFGHLPNSIHEFYAVTVRDPFDRTVSAFVFEHLKNRLARNETIDVWKVPKYEEAYKCFPTLQSFVDSLGYNPRKFHYPYSRRSVHADSCHDLASAALYGRIKLYNHLYFSLDRIRSFLPLKNLKVFAIRQEHLWDDWKSVNLALGQPNGTVYVPRQSQSHRNTTKMELELHLPVKRSLSQQGRMVLCNALREEYRAYFWLLQHAENFHPSDVQASVADARRKCPVVDMEELFAEAAASKFVNY